MNFYGEFNSWMSFKELILSFIDENSELMELQKPMLEDRIT